MFELVEASCPKPDLLVYLYLDVAELQANIRKRGRTYEAHITDAYLENIQRQYMEFIRQHQDMRVVIINTQGLDFVSHEADYLTLQTLIQREYPIGITRISDLS